MSHLDLRSTSEVSYEQWLPLWNGIHLHHGGDLISDKVSRNTFHRLALGCPKQGALRGVVAFLDDIPVGFAHYFLHQSSYQDEPVAELEDLFVVESARQKGVGRALLDEVFHRVKRLGATEIRWVTMNTNTAARALYAKVACVEDYSNYRVTFPES